MNITPKGPLAVLKEVFGFGAFRNHQGTLVEGLLAGKDVFGVMPTGGGKSLCYQLPAVMAEGCAVVVSPLIALMKDQVDAACANGIRACCVNSAMSLDERKEAARAYREGELDLLYVAPERLCAAGFLDKLRNCPTGGPAFFAIDEAHCLSEWGHDFRPDYLFLSELRGHFPETPIAAFTATATRKVADDIEKRLGLELAVKVRASFDRENLYYEVRSKADWEKQMLDFIKARQGECGIIYRTSRKNVEATASFLQANGVDAMAYHAGLEPGVRAKVQEDFLRDNCRVIVATIAFGMGIDKSDVRYVVHGDVPKTIESYYQETGRAGRDGEPSRCLLLYAPADAMMLRRFADEVTDAAEKQRTLGLLRAMERFATTPQCRRKGLLNYFDQVYEEPNCGGCDYCDGHYAEVDATRDAQIVMSAMLRTGERFGGIHVCDVVVGANTQKIRDTGHNLVKTYGVGKDKPKSHWRSILNGLIASGAVRTTEDSYAIPKVAESGRLILKGQESFLMAQDTRQEQEKSAKRSTEAEFPYHAGLFEALRAIRKELADAQEVPPFVVAADRTLRQIAALMPRSMEDLAAIHGMGRQKMESYGQAFIDGVEQLVNTEPEALSQKLDQLPGKSGNAVTSAQPVKRGGTFETTHTLLKEGLSPTEIAAKRELALSTVESHVAKLLGDGAEIDPRQFVSEEKEKLIRGLLIEHGTEALKPTIEAANGAVTYGEAKIVVALVEREFAAN